MFDRGDLSPAIGAVRYAIGPTGTDIVLILLCLAFVLIVATIIASGFPSPQ